MDWKLCRGKEPFRILLVSFLLDTLANFRNNHRNIQSNKSYLVNTAILAIVIRLTSLSQKIHVFHLSTSMCVKCWLLLHG
jgi:hypothetical protein